MADLSEKQYPKDKDQLIGLISLRNRLMRVMEYDGGEVMRDLTKDNDGLKSDDFLLPVACFKSKIPVKQQIANLI